MGNGGARETSSTIFCLQSRHHGTFCQHDLLVLPARKKVEIRDFRVGDAFLLPNGQNSSPKWG
jgi:hypothetical protein